MIDVSMPQRDSRVPAGGVAHQGQRFGGHAAKAT
jgi:hypothetical protein